MNISTRGRYGLRALLDLALNFPQGPVPLKDIASRQGISAKYLEQLFVELKKAGLIKSARGARGGYLLARQPPELDLYEIVCALEGGSLHLVDCLENPEFCRRQGGCAARLVWLEMELKIKNYLRGLTLADLVKWDKSRTLGEG
jgi:Rrf2 family protein